MEFSSHGGALNPGAGVVVDLRDVTKRYECIEADGPSLTLWGGGMSQHRSLAFRAD